LKAREEARKLADMEKRKNKTLMQAKLAAIKRRREETRQEVKLERLKPQMSMLQFCASYFIRLRFLVVVLMRVLLFLLKLIFFCLSFQFFFIFFHRVFFSRLGGEEYQKKLAERQTAKKEQEAAAAEALRKAEEEEKRKEAERKEMLLAQRAAIAEVFELFFFFFFFGMYVLCFIFIFTPFLYFLKLSILLLFGLCCTPFVLLLFSLPGERGEGAAACQAAEPSRVATRRGTKGCDADDGGEFYGEARR
jgi:hypothetical protein